MGSSGSLDGRDVRAAEFSVAKRGYHPIEVDTFLANLAVTLDRLHEQRERSEASEAAAVRLLKTANETAESLVAEAAVEANRLRTEGFREAAWARSEATVDADRVRRRTAEWLEEQQIAAAANAAATNEQALRTAAAILEEAQLQANDTARRDGVDAGHIQDTARREVDEASAQIERAHSIISDQADRLRSGAMLMAETAEELEEQLTTTEGKVIDLTRGSRNEAGSAG